MHRQELRMEVLVLTGTACLVALVVCLSGVLLARMVGILRASGTTSQGSVREFQPLVHASSFLRVPESVSHAQGEAIRKMLNKLPYDRSKNASVFLCYACGRREQDADGYGPGTFFAAAVTKHLFDNGIFCFSNLMLENNQMTKNIDSFCGFLAFRDSSCKVLIALQTASLYDSWNCLHEIYTAQENHMTILPLRFGADLPSSDNEWPQITRQDLDSVLMVASVQSKFCKLNSMPSPPYTVIDQPGVLDDLVVDLKSKLEITAPTVRIIDPATQIGKSDVDNEVTPAPSDMVRESPAEEEKCSLLARDVEVSVPGLEHKADHGGNAGSHGELKSTSLVGDAHPPEANQPENSTRTQTETIEPMLPTGSKGRKRRKQPKSLAYLQNTAQLRLGADDKLKLDDSDVKSSPTQSQSARSLGLNVSNATKSATVATVRPSVARKHRNHHVAAADLDKAVESAVGGTRPIRKQANSHVSVKIIPAGDLENSPSRKHKITVIASDVGGITPSRKRKTVDVKSMPLATSTRSLARPSLSDNVDTRKLEVPEAGVTSPSRAASPRVASKQKRIVQHGAIPSSRRHKDIHATLDDDNLGGVVTCTSSTFTKTISMPHRPSPRGADAAEPIEGECSMQSKKSHYQSSSPRDATFSDAPKPLSRKHHKHKAKAIAAMTEPH